MESTADPGLVSDVFPSGTPNASRLVDGIDIRTLADGTEFEIRREECPPGVSGETVAGYYKNYDAYRHSNIFATQDVPDDDDGEETTSPFEKIAATMVSLTECGGVLKRVQKEGHGDLVSPEQVVRVHYNAFQEFQDEPYDSTYLRGAPLVVRLEEGEVILGLEIAIKSMCPGEESDVLIRPHCAYGERGCPPRIAPNATLLFRIQVLTANNVSSMSKIMKMPMDERKELSMKQLVQAASEEREDGNKLFNEGKYKVALSRYTKAIKLLENSQILDEAEERLQQRALVKLYLNAAACRLQFRDYPGAINYCNRVLEIEPAECKAIYRKGVAKKQLGDYDEARSLFMKAYASKPHDAVLAAALKDLEESEKMSKITEKKMCLKMFSGMSSCTLSPSAAAGRNKGDSESEDVQRALSRLRDFANNSDMQEFKLLTDAYTNDEIATLTEHANRLNLAVSQEKAAKSSCLLRITKTR